MTIMKTCIDCKHHLSLAHFSKHHVAKDGHRNYCTGCAHDRYLARRSLGLKNPKHTPSTLICRACKEDRSIDNFYPNINNANGYENICTKCSSKKSKAHRDKGYIQPRINNGNPSERAQKRRVLIKYSNNIAGEMPKGWRQALFSFYNNKCLRCGSQDRLEADHVIPLSKGGLHMIENMQPLCITHNRSKHANEGDYRNGLIMTTYDLEVLI